MAYQVVNIDGDEIVFRTADENTALKMADALAAKANYENWYGVVELSLRYWTEGAPSPSSGNVIPFPCTRKDDDPEE